MTQAQVAGFVSKLHSILEESSYQDIICWSTDDLQIKNRQSFIEDVLPNFFRHQKIESFVRQLNLYGFKKILYFSGTPTSSKDNRNLAQKLSHLLPFVQLKSKSTKDSQTSDSISMQESIRNTQDVLEVNKNQFKYTVSQVSHRLKRVIRQHPNLEPQLKEALQIIKLCSLRQELGFIPSTYRPHESKQAQHLINFDSRLSF